MTLELEHMEPPTCGAAICLHHDDHVAIATTDLPAGMAVLPTPAEGLSAPIVVRQSVPAGHKLALRSLAPGEAVRRYGQVIGVATRPVSPGEHVHTHNLGVQDFSRDPAFGVDAGRVETVPAEERRVFLGYRRADGRVGTRNYVAVLATVNCSAHAARQIAHHFSPGMLAAFPHVDGVVALTHGYGCPMPQALLQRSLAGMAGHPNVGAWVLVGLGCETNQANPLAEAYGLDRGRGRILVIQDLGGIGKTVQAGVEAVKALLPLANAARRTAQPVSDLLVALQCGGSDGWSGVTANPLVGLVSDELVRQAGGVLLAETPEIVGAEHLLTRRAADRRVGEKLLEQVRWWGEYARQMGLQVDDNRSVGNEAGGLTTIYEKSLGAVAKSGSTPLTAVYDYAERVTTRGLSFMNTPGYDPVAVTGQVAGGCNLVLFTTGRGSAFGFKPAPCLKISSNTAIYRRMQDDMDLDAGRILTGLPMERLAAELFDLVIAVASGQPTKSEQQGIGEAEFCPWNREGTL